MAKTAQRSEGARAAIVAAAPGVAFCAALAPVGYLLSRAQSSVPVSPMMYAIGLAIAYSSLAGPPAWARAGNAFTLRRLLRFA
ncbi:MAG TPA: hypothetical protein VIL72_08090, partial [Beijerinckiaceae bacterium]